MLNPGSTFLKYIKWQPDEPTKRSWKYSETSAKKVSAGFKRGVKTVCASQQSQFTDGAFRKETTKLLKLSQAVTPVIVEIDPRFFRDCATSSFLTFVLKHFSVMTKVATLEVAFESVM